MSVRDGLSIPRRPRRPLRRIGRRYLRRATGRLHVEREARIAACGLDLAGADEVGHPASWREVCLACVAAIRREEDR